MMDALPNIIPKSIIEVLNRLENDEDNRYSWKLTRNQDSLSFTVSCKLPAKTPNKAKDDSEVAGRGVSTQLQSSGLVAHENSTFRNLALAVSGPFMA